MGSQVAYGQSSLVVASVPLILFKIKLFVTFVDFSIQKKYLVRSHNLCDSPTSKFKINLRASVPPYHTFTFKFPFFLFIHSFLVGLHKD